MWIVRLALRRPYTVATLCLVIAVLGGLSLSRLKVDVLPAIDIPVVAVVWNYPGLIAEEMEKRVITLTERAFSTTVGDAEIWLDNANGGVVAGVFVHATLHVRIPPLPVVPSNAILSRGDETLVAVVQNQDKLHLVPVTTGLDDGKTVQVRQGLRGGETVALDVPSELSEGARIQPLTPKQQKPGAPQARSEDGPRRGSAEQKDEKDGEAGPSPNR